MMPTLFFAFILIVVGISFNLWIHAQARKMIETWAAKEGYLVLEKEYRAFRRGPYDWKTPPGRMVFRVVVQSAAGQQRRGWLRLGDGILGMGKHHVDATWDA